MFLESAADLHGALHRRFRTRVKGQRHPVAGGDPSQTARSFGSLKLLGRANNPVQFLNRRVLVVNRKLRVANDVDEQDMRDLKLDLFLNFRSHLWIHMEMPDATILSSELPTVERKARGHAPADHSSSLWDSRRDHDPEARKKSKRVE